MQTPRSDILRDIEWDCHQLVSQLFIELDARRFDAAAALLAADAVWIRATQTDNGRQAIIATSKAMAPTRTVQHVLGGVAISVADDRASSTLRAQVVAYLHDTGTAPKLPAPIERPHSVLMYEIRCVATAEGWRIRELSATTLFRATF